MHVKGNIDWEGDEILEVVIVFEGKKLNHKKTLRLGPLVHQKPAKFGDSRFPMIEFVIKDGAREPGIAMPQGFSQFRT